jgi:hypothetical protein
MLFECFFHRDDFFFVLFFLCLSWWGSREDGESKVGKKMNDRRRRSYLVVCVCVCVCGLVGDLISVTLIGCTSREKWL